MNWISLTVEAEAAYIEELSDVLLELGAISVSITDAQEGTQNELPLFDEPGVENPRQWPHNKIVALYPEGINVPQLLGYAAEQIGLVSVPAFNIALIPDIDWVKLNQSQFQPIQILPKLWIVPSWHQPPDPQATNIILDPGPAFGTGHHPTTSLCLQWLATHIRGGEQILDYGCGSGILTIAAMKLGASLGVGVDIDPSAIVAAKHNAVQNNVIAQFVEPNVNLELKADIVIANILANPLKILTPILTDHTRSGGALVLSGVLSDQAGEVIAAYADAFQLTVDGESENWIRLSGIKR